MNSVGKMAQLSSVPRLGIEFDDFLFASVGANKNGMLLSVLSALAQSDVNPGQEAAEPAGLPEENGDQKIDVIDLSAPGRSVGTCGSVTMITFCPAGPGPVLRRARRSTVAVRRSTRPSSGRCHQCRSGGLHAGHPMDGNKPSYPPARRKPRGQRRPARRPQKWPRQVPTGDDLTGQATLRRRTG